MHLAVVAVEELPHLLVALEAVMVVLVVLAMPITAVV
jgi:hypothetical protein